MAKPTSGIPTLSKTIDAIDQPYSPEEGYHLSKDLADHAIQMIKDQKAGNPSKPWYMWFCPGANHAPHHAPQEYIDKYKGKFDDGYEAYREWVLPRMIAKGILPEGTQLTPFNPMPAEIATPADQVRPWNTLNADEKKLFSRLMEVYAGFSEYTDVQVGRIIDYLEKSGQLENTIVLYAADNGASGEGSPNGTVNENKFFNSYPDELSENMKLIDKLGGPDTYEHYPTGWAAASSAPFKMFKRYSEYSGGTCDPLVISWPKGIKARGEVRNQYHHSTDIVPTILDICGLEMPRSTRAWSSIRSPACRCAIASTRNRTRRQPRSASTMLCSAPAGSGRRAGKPPLSTHRLPQTSDTTTTTSGSCITWMWTAPSPRTWPRSILRSCKALIKAWFEEAEKNLVLPLDDRTAVEILTTPRPTEEAPRERYIYYPGTSAVPESAAVNVRGRSYKILADVEIADPNCSGVIFAHGSRFGGHALFIEG